MPQIGPLEILIVGIIALIVFGPEKLPGILRSTGRAISELRRMATEVKTEFESGLDTEETATPPEEPVEKPAADSERSRERQSTDERSA